MTLRFFFFERMSSASFSKRGPTTTSRNMSFSASTAAASTQTLNGTIPPKADSGSVSFALRNAFSAVSPSPTPQGLVCLMMAHAVFGRSQTSAHAASRSRMLLYESSLPWCWISLPR